MHSPIRRRQRPAPVTVAGAPVTATVAGAGPRAGQQTRRQTATVAGAGPHVAAAVVRPLLLQAPGEQRRQLLPRGATWLPLLLVVQRRQRPARPLTVAGAAAGPQRPGPAMAAAMLLLQAGRT